MDAPASEGWLSREQIDAVIEGMSAADLVAAMGLFDSQKQSTQWAMAAFDLAAARQEASNGTAASEHVRLADFAYLAQAVGEAINIEAPLSEGQEG